MVYANNADKINFNLKYNVGFKSKNLPSDVINVQKLLNLHTTPFPDKTNLKEDGLCGSKTIDQILLFQKHISRFKKPDSVISPDGRTYRDLTSKINLPQKAKETTTQKFKPNKYNIDLNKFIELFAKEFPRIKNLHAVRILIQKMLVDPRITDLRWIPYILATIWRECGENFESIREVGSGAKHPYGKPDKFIDPVTNIEYQHIYYGRGYCQLTWLKNYIRLGNEIGLGNQLAINPDLALDKEIAYNIIITGMTKGKFTGVGLSRFIAGEKCSYYYARQIINRLDHAQEIAEVASTYLIILNASGK